MQNWLMLDMLGRKIGSVSSGFAKSGDPPKAAPLKIG